MTRAIQKANMGNILVRLYDSKSQTYEQVEKSWGCKAMLQVCLNIVRKVWRRATLYFWFLTNNLVEKNTSFYHLFFCQSSAFIIV